MSEPAPHTESSDAHSNEHPNEEPHENKNDNNNDIQNQDERNETTTPMEDKDEEIGRGRDKTSNKQNIVY